MFSGIVEAMGRILKLTVISDSKQFVITRPASFIALNVGESIAVNGVCLTVTEFDDVSFTVTAVPETLSRTNLQVLELSNEVNLERAMRLDSRLGGHFVQGHVDAVGKVLELVPVDDLAYLLKIAVPEQLTRYIVPKGFITLDGMSLTVIDVTDDWFTVTLIPHTLAVTISQHYQVNQLINLEVDMISKYIEKIVGVYLHARH